MRRSLLILVAICLLILPGAATAASVTWTFSDVVFDDGGTLTGCFVWDFDTNEYGQSTGNCSMAWLQGSGPGPIQTTAGTYANAEGGPLSDFDYFQNGDGEYAYLDFADGDLRFVSYVTNPEDPNEYRYLHLGLGSPLTSAGGDFSLISDGCPSLTFGNCLTEYDTSNFPDFSGRLVVSGTLSGVVDTVPEAQTLSLSVAGGLCLWFVRRRRGVGRPVAHPAAQIHRAYPTLPESIANVRSELLL